MNLLVMTPQTMVTDDSAQLSSAMNNPVINENISCSRNPCAAGRLTAVPAKAATTYSE